MKVDIPMGDNVININLVKESRRTREIMGLCAHGKITVDTTLMTLECDLCGKSINPVGWIAGLIDKWSFYVEASEKYQNAIKLYEGKSRTKCNHCHKMTNIRPAKGWIP